MAGAFIAVKYGLTNTNGEIDQNNELFQQTAKKINEPDIEAKSDLEYILALVPQASSTIASSSLPLNENVIMTDPAENLALCKINAVSKISNFNALAILKGWQNTHSSVLVDKMILPIKIRSKNRQELETDLENCQLSEEIFDLDVLKKNYQNKKDNLFEWQNEQPWQIIKEAILKDKNIINKAAEVLKIKPRLIVAVMIVEQQRLYYTQRELFEKFFKPLKILANANKMAWGVMSIKEKTAIEIEDNLKNKKSDYYLGSDFENLLNFKSNNPAKERYQRLTDSKNHYYSYLYGGLIIKQFIAQWQKQNIDISDRPEILATLFNIGSKNSRPKNNPEVGGSTININNVKYTFGSLAYEFYYSGELAEEFPY